MSYPLSLVQSQNMKQLQRLIMSPQMQQAIHLLQMPILELASAIEAEMEQNPLLEYSNSETESDQESPLEQSESEWNGEEDLVPETEMDFDQNDFEMFKKLDEEFRDLYSESGHYSNKKTSDEQKKQTYQENLICAEPSLFEYLMQQSRETFDKEEALAMAEILIGHLDERGFLTTSLEEIAFLNNFDLENLQTILSEIQTFEPFGIGATNLQESLLIQLRCKHQEDSLAYQIVDSYFEDLLHNRILQISKGLECSPHAISHIIQKSISNLDLHPGSSCSKQLPQPIIPDLSIKQDGEKLIIQMNDDFTPSLRLNAKYMKMLEDPSSSQDTKEFIQHKLSSAKWLLRSLGQRNSTLERIVQVIIEEQKEYLQTVDGKLIPMTMKSMAERLGLHESTVARAVSNKYVDCPRGLVPLRSFFTNALTTHEGKDISSTSVRDAILDIIANENKERPYSDLKISQLLQEKGIVCARRTVAKYRIEFNLGNAQQRKKF